MRFLCRIGFHDMSFGPVQQERVWVNCRGDCRRRFCIKTCRSCGLAVEKEVSVTRDPSLGSREVVTTDQVAQKAAKEFDDVMARVTKEKPR